MSDSGVRILIARAQALLFPSFARGYGLPLSEALQIGAPVFCSDLPALRERGGDVPEYLGPPDGPGWMRDPRLSGQLVRPPRRSAKPARGVAAPRLE